MRSICVLLISMFLTCAGQAVAGFQEGMDAYDKGDLEEAIREFEKLPEKSGFVLYTLGNAYSTGDGVRTNTRVAIAYYREAGKRTEDGGLWTKLSFHNLGVIYADGLGVTQDYSEAARHYRRAAEMGHPQSQLNLALLYSQGNGVPLSNLLALQWAMKAEAGGDPQALSLKKVLDKKVQRESSKL